MNNGSSATTCVWNTRGLVRHYCALATSIALAICSQATAAPLFKVVELDLPVGAVGAGPSDINDRGVAVGVATKQNSNQAVIWDADGVREIGTAEWLPRAINLEGLIVGSNSIWSQGSLTRLPPYRAGGFLDLRAINDSDLIVGQSTGADGTDHAMAWRAVGLGWEVTDLQEGSPQLGRGTAMAVNNSGVVVGTVQGTAWGWHNGETFRPGGEGVHSGTETRSINGTGSVLGLASSDGGGVVWHDGGWSEIGALAGQRPFTDPRNLNDHGYAVGLSTGRAFLWDAEHGIRDLTVLAGVPQQWNIVFAEAINNRGQIVGRARNADGNERPVRLDPIDLALIPGDSDYNNSVDLEDFGILKANFGSIVGGPERGDYNNDGKSNLADFGLLKQHFGEKKTPDDPIAAVPEPSTWLLATLAGLGLLAFRARGLRVPARRPQ